MKRFHPGIFLPDRASLLSFDRLLQDLNEMTTAFGPFRVIIVLFQIFHDGFPGRQAIHILFCGYFSRRHLKTGVLDPFRRVGDDILGDIRLNGYMTACEEKRNDCKPGKNKRPYHDSACFCVYAKVGFFMQREEKTSPEFLNVRPRTKTRYIL